MLVLAVGLGAVIRGCRPRPRPAPREIVTYLDLQTEPVAFRAVDELPVPEPPPVPEMPPAAPKPEPRLKPPEDIQRSRRRIRRPDTAPPRPAPRPPDPDEIRRLLAQGTPAPTGAAAAQAFPGWYFALVRQRLYDAWTQPGERSAASGLSCEVRLRIQPDGRVTRSELVRPSGNRRMDESVMEAVRSVARLPELPAGHNEAPREVTVAFELTREAA